MRFLTLNKVTLQFSTAHRPALNQINYEIQQGDFVILLGSNGSGKSTLLKLLHQHYQPNSGEIHFHAKNRVPRRIAVLTQNCSDSLFTSLSLYENYLLVKQSTSFTQHGAEREFLAQYLLDFNPNLAHKCDVLVDQLSGGEKQAFALALCLLHPPALLLLDEHTSALDPRTSEQIMQLTQRMIIQHKITCILTTHDLEIALKYGNRILMLREGEVHKEIDSSEKLALSKDLLVQM
jgi:putative ABC transport system ATP-binding protein